MDGSAATFLVENIQLTDAGVYLVLIVLGVSQWWHGRECAKHRRGFHKEHEQHRNDLTALRTDSVWIKKALGWKDGDG